MLNPILVIKCVYIQANISEEESDIEELMYLDGGGYLHTFCLILIFFKFHFSIWNSYMDENVMSLDLLQIFGWEQIKVKVFYSILNPL